MKRLTSKKKLPRRHPTQLWIAHELLGDLPIALIPIKYGVNGRRPECVLEVLQRVCTSLGSDSKALIAQRFSF